MPRWSFEDIKPGEVATYGDRLVTAGEIVDFARQWDPQPFHLDEAAGRASILGGLTASGWHSACLLMRINCDAWIEDSTSLGGPGIEEMAWLKPVRPGDRLSVRRTVLEARPSASRPGAGIGRFLFEVMNQRGEIVMTQRNAILFARRDAPPPPPGSYDAPAPGPEVAAPPVSPDGTMALTFEDVVVGATAQLGAWRFDRDGVVDFARQWDPQPFHLDEAAAAASPFGRVAASGWQTACAWMRLMIAARERADAARRARGEAPAMSGPSPGYRDLRWLKPVYVGDTVSYSSTVVAARRVSRPGWAVVSHTSAGRNQYGEEVFRFDSSVFMPTRDAHAPLSGS
ncbi:MAG: dehydratase [Methylobacteriaceae bacterium]|nr:dehydratase [Methylobacteriaceae bacterium]